MIIVEPTKILADEIARTKGLRNEHHHAVRQTASRRHKKFQRVVQTRRVTLPGRYHGQHFFDLVAEERTFQTLLTGAHLIEVATQGVYLSVVGEVAEGMRKGPAGEGVGGVALVDNGQAALEEGMGKIFVEER